MRMDDMKNVIDIRTALLATICLFLSGCAALCGSNVRPGQVAMCKGPSGYDKTIFSPGKHLCWGPGTDMKYLQISDRKYEHKFNVLCKDSLNLGLTVTTVSSINEENEKLVRNLFKKFSPNSAGIISGKRIYETYASNVVEEEAKSTVAKYRTSEIVKNREDIIKEVQDSIKSSLKDSIIQVRRVTVNNMDFPTSVKKAQQKKARQRIKIETEKARAKRKRIRAKNKIKLAKIQYKERLVEAMTVADSNKVIGDSISPGFLGWKQLKVIEEAAKGPNNWGFVPYSDAVNGQLKNIGKGQIMEERLESKLKDLRESVEDVDVEKGKMNLDKDSSSGGGKK